MILTTTNRSTAPAATILRVAGDVDTLAADELGSQLRSLPLGPGDVLVVDLSAVTFVSCTALSTLAEAQARLGSRLVLAGRSRAVDRLLELTGLVTYFAGRTAPGAVVGGGRDGVASAGTQPTGNAAPRAWTFTRTDLERVRGLLMGVHGCDAEQAWNMLTVAATRSGVPVGELVELLVGARGQAGHPSPAAAAAVLTLLMREPVEDGEVVVVAST